MEELFSPELSLVVNQTHTVTVCHQVHYVHAKLRRLPFPLRESVKVKIQKLKRPGVIERVKTSEWFSPFVVVKKEDGGFRMCVNLSSPTERLS